MEHGASPKRGKFDFDAFNALAAEGVKEWEELKPQCDRALAEVDEYFEHVAEHYNPGEIGGVAIVGYRASV